jgi:hypothetical protein
VFAFGQLQRKNAAAQQHLAQVAVLSSSSAKFTGTKQSSSDSFTNDFRSLSEGGSKSVLQK